MEIITQLSNRAINEYEGLQEEHKKTKQEFERIKKDRDDAINKLKEFQRLSHLVIEEVTVIQDNLDIEKSCRMSAESLASKLNRENKSLKRKSMLYQSQLGPEVISAINFEEEDSAVENEDSPVACSSLHCRRQITELQDKLSSAQEEKKKFANELEMLRQTLEKVTDELKKEKQENIVLFTETVQQKKILTKFNRVSRLALEEYEELQENLELEKDLRMEAEGFAQKMLVEQKKLKRQSQLLLQSASPSEQLCRALEDVSRLTQVLETERLQHQQEMKTVRQQLQDSTLLKEMGVLQQKVELLEEEKKDWEDKYQKTDEQARDLRHRVEELQKRLQEKSENTHMFAQHTYNIIFCTVSILSSSLLAIIRKKRLAGNYPTTGAGAQEPTLKESGGEVVDVRKQAVDEMMERIKKGIQLRPVTQAANRTRATQMERKPSNSALQELKGVLDTMKISSQAQYRNVSKVKVAQTELEKILLRRRCACE
uniref:Shootin-1 n=1 Tax=Lepisosteus oculatus TaxID=7918 RepID=W5MTN7_LEPOC